MSITQSHLYNFSYAGVTYNYVTGSAKTPHVCVQILAYFYNFKIPLLLPNVG